MNRAMPVMTTAQTARDLVGGWLGRPFSRSAATGWCEPSEAASALASVPTRPERARGSSSVVIDH